MKSSIRFDLHKEHECCEPLEGLWLQINSLWAFSLSLNWDAQQIPRVG